MIPLFENIKESLYVVGGEGNYDRELRNLAKSNKNIKFFGKLESKDLAKYYKNALAVIIPSIVPEVFPMVALESLSYGTPIIVNDMGGLPEIVSKSKAGFIFKHSNDIVSAINLIKTNKRLRNKLSINALKAYKEYYSKEIFFKKYFELIKNA